MALLNDKLLAETKRLTLAGHDNHYIEAELYLQGYKLGEIKQALDYTEQCMNESAERIWENQHTRY